jgi:hypothetical protein
LRAAAILLAACFVLWPGAACPAQPVDLVVNGTLVQPAPAERGGVVFVPLRGVFEALGAAVAYEDGMVFASSGRHTVSLRAGSTTASIDGRSATVDPAPVAIGASIYVPLGFVSQAFGVRVRYDAAARTVAIDPQAVHGASKHDSHAPSRMAAAVLPPEAAPHVIDSVYDTVTRDRRSERPGYGRYTYLLLMTPNDAERNAALLRSVMDTTPAAASVRIAPALLNVFEIPETASYDRNSTRAGDPGYALANYDFGLAHELLARACAYPQTPNLCRGALTGPFLLTYGKPLQSVAVANPPYLIVDLQPLNAKGFSHMVAMMKQQVKETDVADGRLVENWSVRLLSTTLDVAEWLPNIVSSAQRIRGALVGGTGPH